ncbi:velvet factor-domain-containing protein [Chlamydoabsidia padenii]|nr:velvet factor-domain-containing protein [Chlamydoabsidia padenii]
MDNNIPQPVLSRYEYSQPTTATATLPPPIGQTGYHPPSDASVPTSSHYSPSSSLPLSTTDQHVIPTNTNTMTEQDQLKIGSIPPSIGTTTIDRIGYDEREMRTYELVVCQQPLHARMCGFGEKDRRPIDPPPIVQLIVRQRNQELVDVQTLQIPFFVLHVTLWSADRTEERNIISNPPKCTRVLMGSLVSSPSLLKNPDGEQGLYFAFPDLSIRTEGRYTLRFSLMKLVSADFQTDAKSKIIAQIFSDAFTVYSAKKFPGMTESTDLSKAFAKQGLKIPIRNDVRSRKSDS